MTRDFVLAFDFGGTKIALATAGLDGSPICRQTLPTRAEMGAEAVIGRAIEAGRQVVDETRKTYPGTLCAVGAATFGVIHGDRISMAPNVPGWEQLPLRHLLSDAFGVEGVGLENDVKAATSAELRWGALEGVDTGLFLNLGTGIAAGLVVGGDVVRGAHGACGEIGYDPRSPQEAVGVRHERAPFEEFAGGRAIEERARRVLGVNCTLDDLFEQASEDGPARQFVDATLDEISFQLCCLAIALDPERIVVGGGLMRSRDVVLPRLTDRLNEFVPFPPQVVEARFSLDAGLMGGIAVALDCLTGSRSPS
jgi:glucokinase